MVDLDRGPHVQAAQARLEASAAQEVQQKTEPNSSSRRQNPTAAAASRTQQQQQELERLQQEQRQKMGGHFGMFFSDDFEDGDGCFDRFRMIFRELEKDILNGFQESVIDFWELGPTQHETSSLHTFCFFNWIA